MRTFIALSFVVMGCGGPPFSASTEEITGGGAGGQSGGAHSRAGASGSCTRLPEVGGNGGDAGAGDEPSSSCGGSGGMGGEGGEAEGGAAGSDTTPLDDGECKITGLWASISPSGGNFVIGADVAIDDPMGLSRALVCAELDPNPNRFECCLLNQELPSGTKVYFSFRFQLQSDEMSFCRPELAGCGSLSQYQAGINSLDSTAPVQLATYPENCESNECSYALVVTAP